MFLKGLDIVSKQKVQAQGWIGVSESEVLETNSNYSEYHRSPCPSHMLLHRSVHLQNNLDILTTLVKLKPLVRS